MQQVEKYRNDDQDKHRQQAAAERSINNRSIVHQVSTQHLDCLYGRAGRQNDRCQNRDLQGIEDQILGIGFTHALKDAFLE